MADRHQRTLRDVKMRRRLAVLQDGWSRRSGCREDARRMTVEKMKIESFLYPERVERPQTRDDCRDGIRPCPFVSCKWHLWMDVTPSGTITHNFPGVEPWDLNPSCALDVADSGPFGLEDVGAVLNVSRQRVDQIVKAALPKLAEKGANLRFFLDDEAEDW